MKRMITYGLLAAFLASPFAMVSAASSNVAVPSSTAGISQMDQAFRITSVARAVVKVASTKRVQAAGGAAVGFVKGFFSKDGDSSSMLFGDVTIPETALD